MSQILGLLLATLLAAGFVQSVVPFSERANATINVAATARSHVEFNEAVLQFAKAHYSDIVAATTGGGSSYSITAAMLKSEGLLSNSISNINLFGQQMQAQVRQDGSGNLEVWSWGIGGTAIGDTLNSELAAMLSATVPNAGVMPLNDSKLFAASGGQVYGSYGKFVEAISGFTNLQPGRAVIVTPINNGQVVGNYLYRNAVPSQPQLNQMNTSLNMANNDVEGVGKLTAKVIEASNDVTVGGQVSATGDIKTQATARAGVVDLTTVNTVNTSCQKIGLQSRDGNGALLSCQDGLWQREVLKISNYGPYIVYGPAASQAFDLARHRFCAVKEIGVWQSDTGCSIDTDGNGHWSITLVAGAQSTGFIHCSATCFD